jgi:hypothetical protein
MILQLLVSMLVAVFAWGQPLTITPISDHIAIKVTSFESPTITQDTLSQWAYPTVNAIIDLRNNPGGNLHDAIAFAALFVTDHNLVPIQTSQNVRVMVTRPPNHPTLPVHRLIVLINKGTASAAEAAAHVLAKHPNSIRIGQTTHGKTTISTPNKTPYKALLMAPVTPNISWQFKPHADPQQAWLTALSLAHQNAQVALQNRP